MMGRREIVGTTLLIITTVCSVSGTTDPCQNYAIINQARRSSTAVRQTEHTDMDVCDVYLETGWYRFTSYTGGEIPTSCVQTNHCSTQVPVWMDGTLPDSNDIVNRVACGNFGLPSNCCTISFDIRVKRCNDSTPDAFYYVYELKPTTSCPMAYCAGNSPLCPDGEVYDALYRGCIETRHIVPCDFEDHGLCEWQQEQDDDLDWAKTTGNHSTGTILPHTDHTTKTSEGNYIFLVTTPNNQPAGKASLISPVVVPSKTEACNMTFYHHLVGSGNLSIHTYGYHSNKSSLIWTSTDGTTRNVINSWTKEVVSLEDDSPFQVNIEGTIGERDNSAVSLDDISFSSGCITDVDGAVRLVDGARFGEGRVEIYHDHEWGTICNRSWTQTEGQVICSQLGYKSALPSSPHYPAPSATPIHLDDVSCSTANVTKISYCIHSRWGHYHPYCNHDMDVSVSCTGHWQKCNDTEFTCSNKICVSPELLCDFTNDCGDHSDEQDCSTYPGRCDFQNNLCDWVQARSDNAGWSLTDGASNPSAPSMDHRTNPAGGYLLLDSASAQTAEISLPQQYLSTGQNCKILLHYFITTTTGQLTLRVLMGTNETFEVTFPRTPEGRWLRNAVPILVNATFQVTLEGKILSAGTGVIAIDDVSLTPDCVRVQASTGTPTTHYSPHTMGDLFSTTRSTTTTARAATATTRTTYHNPKSRNQNGPAVSTDVIVIITVFLAGIFFVIVAFGVYQKLRLKRSGTERRPAMYELDSRIGHHDPREESQYEGMSNQTWAQFQSAQSSVTTAADDGKTVPQPRSMPEAKGTNNAQKHNPTENIPCAGKTVPHELSVNIDSGGYASLLKNAVEPVYTSPLPTTPKNGSADLDLICYLSKNGFAEFTDMFIDKGLTLSFLRTATEAELINFGIPIAIAVAVVKKIREIPIKENEYTSLQIDASGYANPDFRASTPVAEVNI